MRNLFLSMLMTSLLAHAETEIVPTPVPAAENAADPLTRLAESVSKTYNLSISAPGISAQNSARRFFSETIALLKTNPAAAKDANVGELLFQIIEPAKLDEFDEILHKRLYVELPKANREWGVRVWARWLRKRLLQPQTQRGSATDLLRLQHTMPGYDVTIVKEAAHTLSAELKKSFDLLPVEEADPRIMLALALSYCGASIGAAEFDKLIVEAEKLGSTQRLPITEWGEGIVQSGNPEGLRFILLGAKGGQGSRAHDLGEFESLAGLSNNGAAPNMALFSAKPDDLLNRIEERLKWLSENEKRLQWVDAEHRFKLGEQNVVSPPKKAEDF